ncbi:hypothetical protein [Pseudodonghicola sp.]|uniref:hypothetical protein n=1 Tax=Pseudodonghicola sp. TaxID=1969463 RepID=UPI003A97C14B
MKKGILLLAAVVIIAALAFAFSKKDESGTKTVEEVPTPQVEAYEISVEATAISAYKVLLKVQTTIPLPVDVMASVSIKDQKPTDTYIGASRRVTLNTPEQIIEIDGSSENLPRGAYFAEVTFYPRWGAESGPAAAKKIKEEISGQDSVALAGSGASKDDTDRKNDSQKWVMLNVEIGTPWNENLFVSKLGRFTKSAADLNLHDAYYFPDTDMTIIVSRIKGTVAIWRMGRATK